MYQVLNPKQYLCTYLASNTKIQITYIRYLGKINPAAACCGRQAAFSRPFLALQQFYTRRDTLHFHASSSILAGVTDVHMWMGRRPYSCIFGLILASCLYLCRISGFSGAVSKPEKQAELLRLEKYIESLKEYTRNHPKQSNGWIKLGEAYQSRDISFHDGGSHQPKALHAYEKALSLPLNDMTRLDVIFKKGLLFYMIMKLVSMK